MSLHSEFRESKRSLDFATSVTPYINSLDKATLSTMYLSLLRSHLEMDSTLEALMLLFTGLKPCQYKDLTEEAVELIVSKRTKKDSL